MSPRAQDSWSGLPDLLHADEKALLHRIHAVHRGGASLPSLHAVGASHGLDERTVTYLLGLLVDEVDRPCRSPPKVRATTCSILCGTTRSGVLPRAAASPPPGRHTPSTSRGSPTQRGRSFAVATGGPGSKWLELEHDNLWAALTYARDAHDAGIAARLASLAWYLHSRSAAAEAAIPSRLALAGRRTTFLPISSSTHLAFSARDRKARPRGRDRDRGSARNRDKKLTVGRAQVGLAQATLALAVAHAGDVERGATLAEQARATLKAGPDHWAFMTSLLRAHIAAAVGTPPRSRP